MDRLGIFKVDIVGLPSWYRKALLALIVEVYFLLVIGASVRVMDAGLACPDWPLCFGDYIPDYHPQVYFEFIHRVLAGLVSIGTLILTVFLVFRSKVSRRIKILSVGTLILLLLQVIFGGLTVLLQLHEYVVAAHLGMGTAFFSLLLIQYLALFKIPRFQGDWRPRWWKPWTRVLVAAVFAQIILGGLVASHYAGMVCTDFPTCNGQWFPTFRGAIGLQVIHRLGAYILSALIVGNAIFVRCLPKSDFERRTAYWLMALMISQLAIGISNVLLFTPPLLAIMHLAVGVLILTVSARQAIYASKSG